MKGHCRKLGILNLTAVGHLVSDKGPPSTEACLPLCLPALLPRRSASLPPCIPTSLPFWLCLPVSLPPTSLPLCLRASLPPCLRPILPHNKLWILTWNQFGSFTFLSIFISTERMWISSFPRLLFGCCKYLAITITITIATSGSRARLWESLRYITLLFHCLFITTLPYAM